MKGFWILLLTGAICIVSAEADLTIIESVQGLGPPSEVTVKIKGDKLRVDATPDVATIFNAGTGEMLQVLKAQKSVIRISGEKMKAATELMDKHSGKSSSAEKAKLSPTGKKEKINGYEAEEYVTDTPSFKARYWVARNYPNGEAIFRELQSIKPPNWDFSKMGIPDFTELPALPIKTVMTVGGAEVTSTITAIKRDALSDADFSVPPDFKELQMPDLGRMRQGEDKKPAGGASPEP